MNYIYIYCTLKSNRYIITFFYQLINYVLLTEGPLVYKETEMDCKVDCGLQTSNSIINVIVISGGRCGQWNYCNGSEIDTYSPGLPYK